MAFPSAYTNNFCPNPSIETDITGYAPLLGTEQVAQANVAWSGSSGLQVTTPGNMPGEGVSTPPGQILASVTGSATLFIVGETGTLTIKAVQNPGGQVLATSQVQLDGRGWQRVELDNLGLAVNDTLSLLVFTTVTQSVTFFIDAVQYEPESPAHPYIDGDSMFGTWTGTPEESASFQQYQFPISAGGGILVEGSATLVVPGGIIQIPGPIVGEIDASGVQHPMVATTELINGVIRPVIPPAVDTGIIGLPWEIAGGGSATLTLVIPGSGFTDFAVFATGTDPDPAMTLIGANNAGTNDGTSSYTRIFGAFSPPQQVLDANGDALWQAAAYMAAGFRIAGQTVTTTTAANAVNFAQVQVEKGSTDTAYQQARALLTIVKPTMLNYITNPSLAVSTAGWTAVGGATLTRVAGGVEGGFCLQVSVPAANGGASISVPDLIFGDTFIASASVRAVSSNIVDIQMSIGGAEASANPAAFPFGVGGYGAGPYGGLNDATAALATSAFNRPSAVFQAPASTGTLTFTPVAVTGATFPLVFQIDAVMVSPGEVLLPFGDGSTDGWQWELGGTAGLSRSYFYEREAVGASAVQSVLNQHIPLGITALAPQFAVPPTQ